MRNRRFTADEDARLLELRKQFPGGKGRGGVVDIAAIMERKPSSVSCRLRKLEQPGPQRRRFTPEDDALLRELRREQGAGARAIGRIMQREPSSIQWRLAKFEGRQA